MITLPVTAIPCVVDGISKTHRHSMTSVNIHIYFIIYTYEAM